MRILQILKVCLTPSRFINKVYAGIGIGSSVLFTTCVYFEFKKNQLLIDKRNKQLD